MPPNPATPAPAESGPIRLPVTMRYHGFGSPTAILDRDGRDALPTPGIPWDREAAQIVAALNATEHHDKLVEQLGIMIGRFECCARVAGSDQEYVDMATADARVVLAAAIRWAV